MNRTALIAGIVAMVSLAGVALGQDEGADDPPQSWLEAVAQRETLTANWAGMGGQLESEGIAIALSSTQIYQINLEGALSTHRHSGRYTGGYDLQGEFDLERLMGLKGGLLFAHAVGAWSEGLDASSIGSVGGFEVNADAGGNRSIDLVQLYYQQSLFDDALQFRIGKLDNAVVIGVRAQMSF